MNIDVFQLPGIVLKRIHYVILTVIVCLLLALVFILNQKPFYRSTAEIFVDLQQGPVVGLDPTSAGSMQQLIGSQVFLLQSRDVLRDVVNRLNLQDDPYLTGGGGGLLSRPFGTKAPDGDRADAAVDSILENVTIARSGDTFVFDITMKHSDSDMAAKIANAIAESYLSIADTSRLSVTSKTAKTIEEQTEELRQRVLDARAAVETFRAENGLLTTGEQGLIVDQQLAALNQQLIAARQQAEQQKTAYDQAQKLNRSDVEAGAIPEVLQSTALTSLRSRYAQMLDRQAELSASLGSGHPQMRAIQAQIAATRNGIETELGRIRDLSANTYARAKANLASVQKRFDEQTAATGDNGKLRFRLAQLISEADTVDTVYKAFLARSEELGRQQDIGNGNSRIISTAVPSAKRVQASKVLVLIAAMLFGTAAGAALAVLREILGGKVRSEKDLVTRTGAPVLAVIEQDNVSQSDSWNGRLARVVPFARSKAGLVQGVSGLTRAAHLLEAQFEPGVPVTIAVLSAGGAGNGNAAVGIAQELKSLGQDVRFSDGEIRRLAQTRIANGGSVRIRTDLARAAHHRSHGQTLEDMLAFRRLGGETQRRLQTLSSVRVSTAVREEVADFTIIDCCGTPAEAILPAILRHVDGILVVSRIGGTGNEDLQALVSEIAPWRDKLVGNILVGDRAA